MANGLVVRSAVEAVAKYGDYREQLRYDFYFACAYCSITECEARGIAFEIDHYIPLSRAPEKGREYANLMYSCRVCNREKSDYCHDHQSADDRVIRIDTEDPADHLAFDGEEELKGLTQTGVFNIKLLRLNRLSLRRLRRIRAELFEHHVSIAFGLRFLLNLRSDHLKKSQRFIIERYRTQAQQDARALMSKLAEHIRAESRSELLDAEESPPHSTQYKKYLRRQKAVTPDYVGDAAATGKRAAKPTAKRRGRKRR